MDHRAMALSIAQRLDWSSATDGSRAAVDQTIDALPYDDAGKVVQWLQSQGKAYADAAAYISARRFK